MFTVFPNPTKSTAFVNLSNSLDVEHSITVFDVAGKKHLYQTANNVKNNLFQLELGHLAKGVYIVEVRNAFSLSSKS